ncbi:MAG TPA: methyltransferase domain-containing protein [Actinophytocola sp.]|uniref:methyltransferase domain-containing protein n=1 Tax=Actinophytocola sp. TaxID=1872138 RepID=UPI002DDCBE56|nr:methyltransferase domain-containing protein [Actinophytocola sp.]HEV2784443.1 methyltransferase domain-containing protein [Actinophytocola sp.]
MSELPETRRAVRMSGLADRFDHLVGAVFSVPLAPAAHDLVLLPHVCHLLEEPATLIRRLVPALATGGTLAVIEPVPGGRDVAVHELALYLRTSGDRTHPPESYVD